MRAQHLPADRLSQRKFLLSATQALTVKFKSLLSTLATCFSLTYHVTAQVGGTSLSSNMDEAMARQRESFQRMCDFLGPDVVPGSVPQTPKRAASAAPPAMAFDIPAAQQFYVDGPTIPDGTQLIV